MQSTSFKPEKYSWFPAFEDNLSLTREAWSIASHNKSLAVGSYHQTVIFCMLMDGLLDLCPQTGVFILSVEDGRPEEQWPFEAPPYLALDPEQGGLVSSDTILDVHFWAVSMADVIDEDLCIGVKFNNPLIVDVQAKFYPEMVNRWMGEGSWKRTDWVELDYLLAPVSELPEYRRRGLAFRAQEASIFKALTLGQADDGILGLACDMHQIATALGALPKSNRSQVIELSKFLYKELFGL